MCARPKKWRVLSPLLQSHFFKPEGASSAGKETADLKGDELEAMRLCYMESLQHEDAAKKMRVSRRTLERILGLGRKKVTEALFMGKAINISFPEYVTFVPLSSRKTGVRLQRG
jgi:predicted DNA-binding protein (UPF0251 family)